MSKFNLEDWEQSLKKYIHPSDLNIPKYEYQVYKESKDVPEHIRYACLYLSIVDKAMEQWWASQHHPLKGLALSRQKKDFLEGNLNHRLHLVFSNSDRSI